MFVTDSRSIEWAERRARAIRRDEWPELLSNPPILIPQMSEWDPSIRLPELPEASYDLTTSASWRGA